MSVFVFGVTHDTVRKHHFPHITAFSLTTQPTSTTVGEMVTAAGAKLAGKLRLKSITVDEADTDSEAYTWCADTIRLDTATRIPPTTSGVDPQEHQRRIDELKERYKDLSEGGVDALGGAGSGASADATSSEPEGPVTHLTENSSIETQDDEDASDSIPRLRYDDEL